MARPGPFPAPQPGPVHTPYLGPGTWLMPRCPPGVFSSWGAQHGRWRSGEAAEVLAWPAGPCRAPRPGLAGPLGRAREELPAPLRLVESSWAAPRLAVPGPSPPALGPHGAAGQRWGAGGTVRGAGRSPGCSRRRPARPRQGAPCAAGRALCSDLLATATCAGYSDDRCGWSGRYEAPEGRALGLWGPSAPPGSRGPSGRSCFWLRGRVQDEGAAPGADASRLPRRLPSCPVPSGLTQEPGSVGQLSLACSEGVIQWLYPAGALRLTLASSDSRLPTPSGAPAPPSLCLARPFAGAQVFAERAGGALGLLLAEGLGPARGRCVRWGPRERRSLFLQATPHPDISCCVASFRFEMHEDRPCSDPELLLAVCTSDFVITGTIHRVGHDTELQESVTVVAAARTLPLFRVGESGGHVQASIHTPLHFSVRTGPGPFLFMGWSHFGEAWLGCAPRFQEFSRASAAAHANHLHPCEVALD
ncbi:hypothetical protein GH733_012217 [Mirounga leonina]|nr:hypothetical protein GH733_012217 [Mirounga leonina]